MFPIRDHNPSGQVPYVTYVLILANVGIFLIYWLAIPNEAKLNAFFVEWGMVPHAVTRGQNLHGLFTSMFLHVGFLHLAGNMLFLWVFGDNLEEVLGHLRYLGFYLLSGLAAAFAQIGADVSSFAPMVGASGAIAGLMGGYLLLFPRAKVDIFIIFIIFFRIIPIPAWIILGLWFAMQLYSGVSAQGDGGVAYWAHAGGFVAGVIFMLPTWLRLGGAAFWRKNHGQPAHPEAKYPTVRSSIPRVNRK